MHEAAVCERVREEGVASSLVDVFGRQSHILSIPGEIFSSIPRSCRLQITFPLSFPEKTPNASQNDASNYHSPISISANVFIEGIHFRLCDFSNPGLVHLVLRVLVYFLRCRSAFAIACRLWELLLSMIEKLQEGPEMLWRRLAVPLTFEMICIYRHPCKWPCLYAYQPCLPELKGGHHIGRVDRAHKMVMEDVLGLGSSATSRCPF